MAQDIKGLIAASKNQETLMEAYGKKAEATIDNGPLENKIDSLIDSFDSTMRSFEAGSKSMVVAFGRSVSVIKSAVEGLVQPELNQVQAMLPAPISNNPDAGESVGVVEEILSTVKSMDENTEDLVDSSEQQAAIAAKAADKVDFGKDEGSATKEASDPFSMPSLGSIGGKLTGLVKGAGKMLGGAAIVLGTVAGVYNGFKAFGDDAKISELTGKQAEAITETDRWNTAVAEGISTMTGGLLSTKDVFGTVEMVLGEMRSAVDAVFDPETGLIGGVVKSIFDWLDSPSFKGMDKIFEELFSSVEKISTWLWENLVPAPIRSALEGIGGAVGSAVSGFFGSDDEVEKEEVDKASKGVFSTIGSFLGSEDEMTPMEKTQQAIQKRRAARSQAMATPSTGLAVPNRMGVDKKPSEITKERNDDEQKFKAQMAASKQKSPVVNTTNVNNITQAPKLEIMNAGSMFAGSGL
jgi:hypothetical protein